MMVLSLALEWQVQAICRLPRFICQMELFLALEWLAQVPTCLPRHLVNLLRMVFMPTLPSALQSEFQIGKN